MAVRIKARRGALAALALALTCTLGACSAPSPGTAPPTEVSATPDGQKPTPSPSPSTQPPPGPEEARPAAHGLLSVGPVSLPVVDELAAGDGVVRASSSEGMSRVRLPGAAAQVFSIRVDPGGDAPAGESLIVQRGGQVVDLTATTPDVWVEPDGSETHYDRYVTGVVTPGGDRFRVADVTWQGDGRGARAWLGDLLADPSLLVVYGVPAEGAESLSPLVAAIAQRI